MPAGPLKDSFVASTADAELYDNSEENAASLKSALEKEKAESSAVKAKLATFEGDKEKEIAAAKKKSLEEARSTGDFAAIEKDYQEQLKAANARASQLLTAQEDSIKNTVLEKAASEIAKSFVSPSLAMATIKARLKVEIVEGEPVVRVTSKDGKASASGLEDLRKEYLTDPDMKASIRAGQGSGGGSGLPTKSGGSDLVADQKFDAVKASPADMISRLEAKGLVSED